MTSRSGCSARWSSSGPCTTCRRRCRTPAGTCERWSSASRWWPRSSGAATAGARTSRAAGARARCELDAQQERLCVPAAAALGADYAGVDLLRGPDGRDYVLEVNGIPGWQGVERATGVDVAGALAEHVETVVG